MSTKAVAIILVAIALLAGAAYYLGLFGSNQTGAVSENTDMTPDEKRAPADHKALLLGTWQSTEDAKFTRTFSADGTTVDRYEGDELATMMGTWETFTSANPDPGLTDVPLKTDTTYIKISGQYEVLFFSLDEVSNDRLVLTYLGRGNVLEFTKVQ